MSEKMTKEERELAAHAYRDLCKAVELLNNAHEECEELLCTFGWDIDAWDISKAAMLTGSVALGVASTFGYEDGWFRDGEEAAK